MVKEESCEMDTAFTVGLDWTKVPDNCLYLAITARFQILYTIKHPLYLFFPDQNWVNDSECTYLLTKGWGLDLVVTQVGMCCHSYLKLLAKYFLCLTLRCPPQASVISHSWLLFMERKFRYQVKWARHLLGSRQCILYVNTCKAMCWLPPFR